MVRSEPAVVTMCGKMALTFTTISFGRVVFSLRFSKMSERSESRSALLSVSTLRGRISRTLTLTLLPALLRLGKSELILQEVEHVRIGFAEHFGSGAGKGEVDCFSSNWDSCVQAFDGVSN